MPQDPSLPRWLDRNALATYISVRVDEIPRLLHAGKLPQPSNHLGPKLPRWWSPSIDEAFGKASALTPRRGAAGAVPVIRKG